MHHRFFTTLFAFSLFFSCKAQTAASKRATVNAERARIEAIIATIRNYYNRGTPDSILRFYATDIVVSYPGLMDREYEGFAEAYRQMKPQEGVQTITRDSIEEVSISGDMAMVRFSWLTTQVYINPAKTVRWRAREFTIWRKEKDGQWRFSRGMWFREKPVETLVAP